MITDYGLRIKGKAAAIVESRVRQAHDFNGGVWYRVTHENIIPFQFGTNTYHPTSLSIYYSSAEYFPYRTSYILRSLKSKQPF